MDEQIIDACIRRLVETNDPANIDSWIGLLLMANQAMSQSNFAEADELFKLSVIFAEENMSQDAVINALLCLAASYCRQRRFMESNAAYARAMKILEENSRN